ncbi:MAG TPA: MBL fold metallo-hydrolase [Nitrolancea sp.]|nr:MBL fold metallo-hydrolase [Nitrolancea sp.]
MEPTIVWYTQSSLRIDAGGMHIYIDPYNVPLGEPSADVILISHEHGDHLSPEDIDRVRTPDSVVFASRLAAEAVGGNVEVLLPGDSVSIGALHVRAVPAYTLTKFRANGEANHPREHDHLGLILDVDGLKFYAAGDTDVIPEMESFGPVDYAFLPVSGRAVMTAEEAAEAVRLVQPSVAIPVHYGAMIGSIDDARRFAELVPDEVRVWIMTSSSS